MSTTAAAEVVRFHPRHASGVSELARAERWPTFSDPERASRLLTAPGVVGLVALRRRRILGAAQVLSDGYQGYLTFLVVAPEARGSGVGRRIVTAAFQATGAQRIDVLSTPEAVGFYRSFRYRELPGFRIFRQEPTHVPDRP